MNSRRIGTFALALAASIAPALARVDVTLDAASLNELLSGMAPESVDVPLAAGRTVTIELHDLKVEGFDPSAGPYGGIRTSVRIKVPELNLDLPVTPRLSVQMKEGADGVRACFLKFDRVEIALPLTGSVDIAPLLPTLPVMPDTAWTINSARGKVRVKPTLLDARTGATSLRLGFDLDVAPAN